MLDAGMTQNTSALVNGCAVFEVNGANRTNLGALATLHTIAVNGNKVHTGQISPDVSHINIRVSARYGNIADSID